MSEGEMLLMEINTSYRGREPICVMDMKWRTRDGAKELDVRLAFTRSDDAEANEAGRLFADIFNSGRATSTEEIARFSRFLVPPGTQLP